MHVIVSLYQSLKALGLPGVYTSPMPEYVTPLMQQYAQIKAQYPDCLILFRLDDFYELFAEDAKLGAELLNITLTRKA